MQRYEKHHQEYVSYRKYISLNKQDYNHSNNKHHKQLLYNKL